MSSGPIRVYLVPRNDGRIIAGATVEYVGYEKTVTAGGVEKNLAAAIELVPGLAAARIDEIWAGLRPDSPDHLPILGPTDIDGLLIATGHFRSGVLLTPITAKLIREWITLQRVSLDWERFSPMRFVPSPGRNPRKGGLWFRPAPPSKLNFAQILRVPSLSDLPSATSMSQY